MISASAHFVPVGHVASVSQSSKWQSDAALHPTSGSALAKPRQQRFGEVQSLALLHVVAASTGAAEAEAVADGDAESDAGAGADAVGTTTVCDVLALSCGAGLRQAANATTTQAKTATPRCMAASIRSRR